VKILLHKLYILIDPYQLKNIPLDMLSEQLLLLGNMTLLDMSYN
jgi:hypothetical protein